MPRFTVIVDTDNEAFTPDPAFELTRILQRIAERISDEGLSGFFETILDANGNDVGQYALKPSSDSETAISR